MKGKKYDAAEKHFKKVEDKLHKQIKYLESMFDSAMLNLKATKNELADVRKENEQLRDWIERLLEYTELTKEDIKKACEKDKQLADSLGLFNRLSGSFLGGFM